MNITGITEIDQATLQELVQQMEATTVAINGFRNVVSILTYVFLAIGLYTIAQKRNLRHPWLAWLPVAQMWLLGSISDHYHRVAEGKNCNRRTRLLVLNISMFVLALVIAVMLVLLFLQAAAWGFGGEALDGVMGIGALLAVIGLLAIPVLVVFIWCAVEMFYAYHDLFCSCNPANKTLFTVLSIVFSCVGYTIVASILIFASRNKTDGLPTETQSNQTYSGYQGPEF